GSSRFYVSLEDDLMRIFAADRISNIMQRLGMEEGVPIESRFVSKQIENAQKRVEGQNFSYRKHVLEYDDVMNKQREAVYGLRRQLLEGEDQKEAYELFEDLMERIEEDTLRFLFLLQPVEEKKQAEQIERKRKRAEFILSQQQSNGGDGGSRQVKRDAPKVGRNDPCPCGS